jgi:hypothetical protein
MPPEYIRKKEPGATPPYSDGGIDQNVLADIRAAVMRKYGGIARQCLRSFRQDVSLGEMAFNSRMTRLGAGVGMNYVSQFGNESIHIRVSEEGVRKLIGESGGIYMLVLYGNNKIACIEMDKITEPQVAFSRTLNGSSFGSPLYWKTYSGPVYYQVAQVKPVSTVHAVSTQLNFSSSGVAPATRGSQQFVYNVATSLLHNAEATETITQDNCAVGEADTYGTYAVTRPYFYPWVTVENYYNGVDDSWRAFDDYFGFFTIDGITPLDNRIYYKSDTDWFLFSGPVINATASKIYNERGDEFSVGTTITKTASGITTEHNADDSEFLAPVSDNRYPYTGYVDTDGIRKGVWTTAIFSALNYSDPIHTYLDSPTIESDDPDYPDLYTYRSTDNNSYESKTGNGSTLEIPYWSKENNLDVLKLGETVAYSTTGEFPILGSRTVGNNGYWTQFGFPYSTGANMNGSWWFEQFEEDDNETFPCSGATIVTPYGDFSAPAANFSFMPWMSLHNGEHTLQAWSIRTAPETHTRYIYLDGVDYGSTLANALGVSINDIRAVFFDIKKSDINRLL